MSQQPIDIPTPEQLDRATGHLTPLERKILGSLVLTMIKHHDRVREREWFAAQFASSVALAMDLEDVGSSVEGIAQVQEFARANISRLGGLAYGIFTRVAAEMQALASFTFEDAAASTMRHLAPDSPDSAQGRI